MKSPCLLFEGYIEYTGYGRETRNGVRRPAHHWALIDAGVTIPDGCIVMHLCDNPSCINAEHLRPGTQSENIRDMYAKGRGVDNRGERNGQAKLADRDAAEIKKRRLAGTPLRALATEFGVSISLVSSIANDKRRASR